MSLPGRIWGTLVPIAVTLLVILTSRAWAQTSSDSDALTVIDVLIMVAVTIYFLPTIVAFVRRHPNRWPIFIINTVFGLTVLGWFGSLIWAFGAVHLSPSGNHGSESGLNLFVNDPPRRATAMTGSISATPLSDEPADELRRLKALHDAGALDEGEYQRLRTGPLGRLVGRG
ncbi:MAG: superinfection immunity protein [Mesorhizobium sp.]